VKFAWTILALLLSVPLPAAPSRRTPPPDSPQKRKEKPVVIPVPDSSWQPVGKPGAASDDITVKRAASRARQRGENRVTGVAGAASAEQLLAWGANQLVFPAGAPAGEQRDYLTRACWFNGQGKPVRDILLLESRLQESTKAAAQALLTLQRDFDLADVATLREAKPPEEPIAVENLHIGDARYRVILIAPSDFWPEDTLDLLLDYIQTGGRVVFVGRQPLSIQRLLFRTGVVRVGDGADDIERGLSYAVSRDLRVTWGDTGESAPAILYQHRSDAKRDYYFVVNTDHENAVAVRLGISVSGSIEQWDLRSGLVTPLRAPAVEIPAGGSVALVVVK